MLLEGDTATESQAPVVPTKHPLSVVDSEELKRKSHGLSLLSPESDDARPPPIGACRLALGPPNLFPPFFSLA